MLATGDTYGCISREIVTVSPSDIFSFFRISALSGNKYAPTFLSGKIDVFHLVFPTVTKTGNEPQPRRSAPNDSLISNDCFLESVTKCHAAGPGYSHTFARTV